MECFLQRTPISFPSLSFALPPLHHYRGFVPQNKKSRRLSVKQKQKSSRRDLSIIRAVSEEDEGKESEKYNIKWAKLKQAFGRGTQRFYQNFRRDLKKETGLDIQVLNSKVVEGSKSLFAASEPFRPKSLELWKEFKHLKSNRIGALVLYISVVSVSFGVFYLALRKSRSDHQAINKLAESYLEASIPDPSPRNVNKLKKGLWRRYMPAGLKVNKYYLGGDGHYQSTEHFVSRDAWEDDTEALPLDMRKVVDVDTDLNDEEKRKPKELVIEASGGSDDSLTRGTWEERLAMWEKTLEKEKLKEDIDALNSKYVISLNWEEVKENFQKQQQQKQPNNQRNRGVWFSKRWWQYRPKLPYTYFINKVECLEVEAVAFSDDFERIYVGMKEGFPSEYIVDIPVDPYLLELLTRCGVEVDTVNTIRQIRFPWLRALAVLGPGIFILGCIYSAFRAVRTISLNQFMEMFNIKPEMIFKPGGVQGTSYKDVVLGGDMWDVLDEILMYLNNPLKYHNKRAKLPRGILLSGPPGTGKTLFARAMANETWFTFVFASGAEFTSADGDPSQKMFDLFYTARSKAPCFVFIDEVDALAGKQQLQDPARKDVYETLLAQLDAEIEHTSVDRYDLRQAIVLICATNRPDDLHTSFLRPGRIDRHIHIRLPGEKERVKIFNIHSNGKRLAKDVNFEKLVFRTVGHSGADIRNLVNEAGIMAIRRGHKEIFQQDIIDVLDKQLFESMGLLVTDEEQRMYEKKVPVEDRRLLAVHEAGHMLLAHLYPRFDWHAFTYLLPGGKATAWSLFYPREEVVFKGYPTVGYLKMQMVVAHGGRCAERIIFGDDISDGGQDDLRKISRIARELVISPANPRLGLLRLTWSPILKYPNPSEMELITNEWEDPTTTIADMSVEVSELFTREVTRYIEEAEEVAQIALRKNKHILDRLAAELFDRSKLTGLEVEEIVKSMNPVILADPTKIPDPLEILDSDLNNIETSAYSNSRGHYQDFDVLPAPLHRC